MSELVLDNHGILNRLATNKELNDYMNSKAGIHIEKETINKKFMNCLTGSQQARIDEWFSFGESWRDLHE